eukprot:TRINITY_DN14833_c0_g3_i3.p1 TRINITY_DN14833_c0_g3~~TRINITY_DN14833_c0_g3_i3.p1  ORF type:complete len:731 (+),score=136.37 TRINITY_DN14833_c0_g3_i3:3-2195(+)
MCIRDSPLVDSISWCSDRRLRIMGNIVTVTGICVATEFVWMLVEVLKHLYHCVKYRRSSKPLFQFPSLKQLLPELSNGGTIKDKFKDISKPKAQEDLKLTYVDTEEKLESALSTLRQERVIGIDIESDSTHAHSISICLIQLSCSTMTYLIDTLALPKKQLEPQLKNLLENIEIIKVFHDSRSDLLWLREVYPNILTVNVFDTYNFAVLLENFPSLGLEKLWERYCDYRVDKEVKRSFHKSNWSKRPLSLEQVRYAAMDSFYLDHIRRCLIKEVSEFRGEEAVTKELAKLQETTYKRQTTVPNTIRHSDWIKVFKENVHVLKEDSVVSEKVFEWLWNKREEISLRENKFSGVLCSTDTMLRVALNLPKSSEELKEFLVDNIQVSDHAFINSLERSIIKEVAENVEKWRMDPEGMKKSSKIIHPAKHPQAAAAIEKKALRREHAKEKYSLKKSVNEHCRIFAPDGELLCRCDRNKINWYVSKGLAEIISEEPLTARLLFVPNGRKGRTEQEINNDLYYTEEKKAICVVCGTGNNLTRYHVVPVVYRQEFPDRFKSHRSHDILLMCFDCHEKCTKYVDETKKELSEEYEVPLIDRAEATCVKNIGRVKTMAKKLKAGDTKISKEQLEDMKRRLLSLLNDIRKVNKNWESINTDKGVTGELLNEIIQIEGVKGYKNTHGEKVVKKLSSIEDFIKMWRRKLLDNMQPKFMPKGWSIDHKVERTFGKKSKFNENN